MVRGRRQKVRSGYVIVSGNPPYGYTEEKTNQGSLLVIDPMTAEVVKMIFEWYVIEKWGSPTISRKLNEMGIPAPSAVKKSKTPRAIQWNQSQVMRILQAETYAGIWRYGKRGIKGKHPRESQIEVEVSAIVSKDIFELAREQRKANTIKARRRPVRPYLLRQRCTCHQCGTHMVAFTAKSRENYYPYYKCPVKGMQGPHYMNTQCSVSKQYSGTYWDQAIWQEIRSFLQNPIKLIKGIKENQDRQEQVNKPLKERLATIDTYIQQKQAELTKLIDLYLSDEFDREILLEKKQRLQTMITSLTDEQGQLENQLTKVITDDEIEQIEEYSQQIAAGLDIADEDFENRRRLLDYLGVTIEFTFEDKTEVAYLTCEFGHHKRLEKLMRASSRQQESQHLTSSRVEEEDNCIPNCMHTTGYRHN